MNMKPSQVASLLRGLNVFKPPVRPDEMLPYKTSVFLAGSIEMAKAVDWQTKFEDEVSDLDLIVMNPRRDSWDSSWEQSLDNPHFVEQVNWELDMLEAATIAVVYFDTKTLSPISLMELGLFAKSGKLLVCCPDGFWRKGNVDVVCQRNNIPTFDSLDELIEGFRKRYKEVQ